MARLRTLAAAAVMLTVATGPQAAGGGAHPPALDWSFSGLFGTFDRGELQRGLQVYREVCAGCHGLQYVAFRDLAALDFNEDEIKAIAAESSYETLDDEGEVTERTGIPADRFPNPFPNVLAAQAVNNGAFPPDLSLIVKARAGGADYIHAVLSGYSDEIPEETLELMGDGQYYNPYVGESGLIAMPPPILEDLVEYSDGTPATVDQMARDVTAFLAWTASPELEARKRLGLKVILFLLVLTGLLYASKRKLWSKLKH